MFTVGARVRPGKAAVAIVVTGVLNSEGCIALHVAFSLFALFVD